MKRNILQSVIEFIFKYIWMFCCLLIVLELVFMMYCAGILVEQSALSVMQSVSGEVAGRVEGVERLLWGLSKDKRFSDTSLSLFERAVMARPYKKSYDLFMIAIGDKDVNIVSTNTEMPTEEPFNLAFRDYMQRLYATGETQITDAFLAGADGTTLNYTIAVPIF